ncbi:MAG TPA: hypothetical protein PKV71_19790 [Calditrichia bacterium]|nr:hypothetical protein [Calditrichia bacterium]HQV34140.1 hypothetical protein [Calditrichia bacterium]
MKEFLKQFLKDIIPVIVGILIALMVNDWQENRSNAAFIERTLAAIRAEHAANTAELEEIMVHHRTARDSLQKYLQNPAVSVRDLLDRIGGFKTAPVKATSWNYLLGKNLELVDFRMVAILSDIDEKRQALKNQINRIANLGYANLNSADPAFKSTLLVMLGDYIYLEEQILADYRAFDDLMKNNPPN